MADINTVADSVVSDAITRIQNLMVSMSQCCSGGSNGLPPQGWPNLQAHGNSAVNALNSARLYLAKDQDPNAVQQINSAEGELDALVNGAQNGCSGGPHGKNPDSYGTYDLTRDILKARLDVVKLSLG